MPNKLHQHAIDFAPNIQRDRDGLEIESIRSELEFYDDLKDAQAFKNSVLIRASAKHRAQTHERAQSKDRKYSRENVKIAGEEALYSRFFQARSLKYSHEKFDGTVSESFDREVFMMADAVTILPYDPIHDRILIIEQLRAGPLARGDVRPWMYEAVAGRIESGQTPEEAGERELFEEAGLRLKAIEKIAEYYPSPGAISEYLYSYLAIVDLENVELKIGGLEIENEDISSRIIDFEELMQMCDSGQLDTGPLYLSALWLSRHRDRLQQQYAL